MEDCTIVISRGITANQGDYDALVQRSPSAKEELKCGVIMLGMGIVESIMPLIPIVFRLMLVTAAGVSLALLTNPSSPMGFCPRNKDPFISM